MSSWLESLRRSWDALSERERRLVSLLGLAFGVCLVFAGFYLSATAASDVEDENDEIVAILRRISEERPRLLQKIAERREAQERYNTKAPSLGSFLESTARESGLAVRDVTDQPEEVQGAYRKRGVRVTMPGVGIKAAIKMLEAIENSPYPIAIERIQIEHFQTGDNYNIQLGVAAWDKTTPERTDATKAPAASRSGNGPPAP